MTETTIKPDLAVAAAGAVNDAEYQIKSSLRVLALMAQDEGPSAELNRDHVRFRALLRTCLRVLNDEASDV